MPTLDDEYLALSGTRGKRTQGPSLDDEYLSLGAAPAARSAPAFDPEGSGYDMASAGHAKVSRETPSAGQPLPEQFASGEYVPPGAAGGARVRGVLEPGSVMDTYVPPAVQRPATIAERGAPISDQTAAAISALPKSEREALSKRSDWVGSASRAMRVLPGEERPVATVSPTKAKSALGQAIEELVSPQKVVTSGPEMAARTIASSPFRLAANIAQALGAPPGELAVTGQDILGAPGSKSAEEIQKASDVVATSALTAIPGMGLPGGFKTAGIPTFFLPSYGQAREQGLKRGMTPEQATVYGVLQGSGEYFSEIPSLKSLEALIQRFGSIGALRQAGPAEVAGFLKANAATQGWEIGTEEANTVASWIIDSASRDPSATPDRLWADMKETAKTMLTAAPGFPAIAAVAKAPGALANAARTAYESIAPGAAVGSAMQAGVDATQFAAPSEIERAKAIVSRQTTPRGYFQNEPFGGQYATQAGSGSVGDKFQYPRNPVELQAEGDNRDVAAAVEPGGTEAGGGDRTGQGTPVSPIVTAEITPSVKLPTGQAIERMTPWQKSLLARQAIPEVMGVAEDLGIPVSRELGSGLYNGNINPNHQITVDNEEDATALARALQYVGRQDAVPWFKPDFNLHTNAAGKIDMPEGSAFGMMLTMPDSAEVSDRSLADAIGDLGYTRRGREVYITNYGGLPEEQFQQRVMDAAGKLNASPQAYTASGHYEETDWTNDPDQEALLQAVAGRGNGAGRFADLPARLRSRRARLAALTDEFVRQFPLQPAAQGNHGEAAARGEGGEELKAVATRGDDPFVISVQQKDIKMPINERAPVDYQLAEIHSLTEENKPLVQGITKEISDRLGIEANDNVKKDETIVAKVNRPTTKANKPWMTITHVRDTYRFKAVVADSAQIAQALQIAIDAGLKVVKPDVVKMLDPDIFGWRMAVFDMLAPNGQLIEFYMPTIEMEKAKNDAGHLLFEQLRDVDWTTMSELQRAGAEQIIEWSNQLYYHAFEVYLRRSGEDANAIRASLNKALEVASSALAKVSDMSPNVMGGASLSRTQSPFAERYAPNAPSMTTALPSSRDTKTSAMGDSLTPIATIGERGSGAPFYSKLITALEGVKMNSASPAQWLATIKNLPGIKQAELDVSDLEAWLESHTQNWVVRGPGGDFFYSDEERAIAGADRLRMTTDEPVKIERVKKPAPITKADLIAAARGNFFQTELWDWREQHEGEGELPTYEEVYEEHADEIYERADNAFYEDASKEIEQEMPGKPSFEVIEQPADFFRDKPIYTVKIVPDTNQYGVDNDRAMNYPPARDWIKHMNSVGEFTEDGWNFKEEELAGEFSTREEAEAFGKEAAAQIWQEEFEKRWKYASEDGTPEHYMRDAEEEVIGDLEWQGHSSREGQGETPPYESYTIKPHNDENYNTTFVTAQGLGNWKDGHGDYDVVKSPIVRLRWTFRDLPDGERTMHIEEMQEPTKAQKSKMPQFLQDNWKQIGLKAALRLAAEHDVKALTWATGLQSAQLYNLSDHVDEIKWVGTDKPEGFESAKGATRQIDVLTDNRRDHIEIDVDNTGKVVDIRLPNGGRGREFIGEKLDAVVGKGVAEKIMASKKGEIPKNELGRFSTSGLVPLYDTIIPNTMRAVLKQIKLNIPIETFDYGHARTKAAQAGYHYTVEDISQNGEKWLRIVEHRPGASSRGYNDYHIHGEITEEHVRDTAERMNASQESMKREHEELSKAQWIGEQRGVRITPELSDLVLKEGQPIFSKANSLESAPGRSGKQKYVSVHSENPDNMGFSGTSARGHVYEMSRKETGMIGYVIGDLVHSGLPLWAAQSVNGFVMSTTTEYDAALYPQIGVIAVSKKNLKKALQSPEGMDKLRWDVAHEFVHVIDQAHPGKGRFLSEDSPRLEVEGVVEKVGAMQVVTGLQPKGDLAIEIFEASKANKDIAKLFTYPYNSLLSGELTEDAARREAFAQAGSFYNRNPERMRQTLPTWFALMESIYGKESETGRRENAPKSHVEAHARLRKALQIDRPATGLAGRIAGLPVAARSGHETGTGATRGPPGRRVGEWFEGGGKSSGTVALGRANREGNAGPGWVATRRPELEKYAGNTNLTRLARTPIGEVTFEDIVDLYRRSVDLSQTRGIRSHAATIADAEAKNYTLAELLGRQPGEAFNAESAVAARNLLVRLAVDTKEAAQKAQRGDAVHIANFAMKMMLLTAAHGKVAGIASEAGRALNSYLILAKAAENDIYAAYDRLTRREEAEKRDMPGQSDIVKAIMEGNQPLAEQLAVNALGGHESAVKMAKGIAAGKNPIEVITKARKATNSVMQPAWVELWKATLLTNPATHIVNFFGNALNTLFRPVESVLTSLYSIPTSERTGLREPAAEFMGLFAGILPAIRAAAVTVKTGKTPYEKYDHAVTIQGMKGEIIRIPYRFLAAGDAFFKAIHYTMTIYQLAARETIAKGGSVRDFHSLIMAPNEAMKQEAEADMDYWTYNKTLGEKGKAFQHLTTRIPVANLVIPFVRTPGNIFKFATERSLAAPMIKEWREDFAAGGRRRARALARMSFGNVISMWAVMMAASGLVSGGGPPDAEKRKRMHEAGWQPYSVLIGGRWYSYRRMEPLGMLIGMAADLYETYHSLEEGETEKLGKMLAFSIANNVTSKTFLEGISRFAKALDPGNPNQFSFFEELGASVIPAGVAGMARAIDPIVREPKNFYAESKNPFVKEFGTIIAKAHARIPFWSRDLPPKLDLYGEPIEREQSGFVNPIATMTPREDSVRKEMAAVGPTVKIPGKKVAGHEMNIEEHLEFQREAGEAVHDRLERLFDKPGYDDLDKASKQQAISDVVRQARSGIAKRMGFEYTDEEAEKVDLRKRGREVARSLGR